VQIRSPAFRRKSQQVINIHVEEFRRSSYHERTRHLSQDDLGNARTRQPDTSLSAASTSLEGHYAT
jgi:hypothetical protein